METMDGEDISTSITRYDAGKASVCGIFRQVDGANLAAVQDITIGYNTTDAQVLLHLRVGTIKHYVPASDAPDAVIGTIDATNGVDGIALLQSGAVVARDGVDAHGAPRYWPTVVACEDMERRRLDLFLGCLWLLAGGGFSVYSSWIWYW